MDGQKCRAVIRSAPMVAATAGIGLRAGLQQHHRRSADQRAEQLPHRHVKAQRCLLKHPVIRAQPEGGDPPHQLVDDGAVLDHHALGASRRAGRVQHVREVGRFGPTALHGLMAHPLLPVGVHTDDVDAVGRQGLAQPRGGDDDRRSGVVEHQGETVARMIWLQGHVRPARFQHREQRHDHVDGPPQTDTHEDVGPDATSIAPIPLNLPTCRATHYDPGHIKRGLRGSRKRLTGCPPRGQQINNAIR
jgi:hypothetical protein